VAAPATTDVPEGDSIRRAARRLQPLVGERVEVETPHPRAAALNIAARLNGRRLERVDAVGKNILLHFEGRVTLRSHLRMNGRWRVTRRGEPLRGKPWLVLRTAELEASQWNGPTLTLRDDALRSLGPDILDQHPDTAAMIVRLRGAPDLYLGEALQRQQLVAGIGNMWVAEVLWATRLSPWLHVRDVSDDELQAVLNEAHRQMSAALERPRSSRNVYRRAGRGCRRCGTPIRSQGQGAANRSAYWCPGCQPSSST
jgi:endonuclease VIII